MPRIPDKNLEERILKAAQRLWRARGEAGFTLRSVAREARTTTPTLYKRFRNKESLRVALAFRIRDEMSSDLLLCSTIEQVHRRYLAYAEAHPREYELMRLSYGDLSSRPRPARAWLVGQLAARFGGQAEDYAAVFDALFLLCNGAATLLTVTADEGVRVATREICIKLCDKVLENAALFRAGG